MSRMASVITPPRPQREKTGAWLGDPCAGAARHRVYAERRRTAPGGAAIVEVRVDERDAGQEKGDSTSLKRAGAMSHGLDPTFYEHDEDDDAPFESYMEQLAIRQEAAKYHGDPAVVRELGTDAMAAGNIMNETPPGLPLPRGAARRRRRAAAQPGLRADGPAPAPATASRSSSPVANGGLGRRLAPMEPFAVAFEHAMIHAARALRRNHEDNYDSLNEEVFGGGEDELVVDPDDQTEDVVFERLGPPASSDVARD
ncbi:hypothetical protein JL721_8224 [Aureococcus anophagefferens]|nr:hypothetical protein JL721_8224 [Aureococcus anophagefferens]